MEEDAGGGLFMNNNETQGNESDANDDITVPDRTFWVMIGAVLTASIVTDTFMQNLSQAMVAGALQSTRPNLLLPN